MDGAFNALITPQIQQWLHAGLGERLHLSSTFLPFLSYFYPAALWNISSTLEPGCHLFSCAVTGFVMTGHCHTVLTSSSILPFAQNHLWISAFPQRQGWLMQTREAAEERSIFCASCHLTRCDGILPTNEPGLSSSQGKNVMGHHMAPSSSIVFIIGEQMSCTDAGWLIAFRQTGCQGTFWEEKCKWAWSQREYYTRPPRNTLGSYYRRIWVLVTLIFIIVIN